MQIMCIGLFYFTLGNIEPKFRSTMRIIQLLCAVKTDYIHKYGIDEILTPFMSDIRELESVNLILTISYPMHHTTYPMVFRIKGYNLLLME